MTESGPPPATSPLTDLFGWRCSRCESKYSLESVRYVCPVCPGIAALDLVPDYPKIGAGRPPDLVVDAEAPSMWRYRRLLPVGGLEPGPTDRLGRIGWTPLTELPRLAARLGMRSLMLKDEGRNLTGSLKDRASALVVAKAREIGESVIVTASTGNAAAALAGCCAVVGLRCLVFVPQGMPEAKMAQLRAYGAVVVEARGDYGAAVELCYRVARRKGWYCRSTAYNPYTAEGKKTAALEIAEQLGWRAPDAVLVPVGDGNILTGLHRGFSDALAMGWIDRIPRLIGVQSTAAPALFDAWRRGDREAEATPAHSRAESINVESPQDGLRALRAVRETGGCFTAVSDEHTMAAVNLLARLGGVFAEPASATTVAALPGLLETGRLRRGESTVLINTGTGLKDPLAATAGSRPRIEVSEDYAALEAELTDIMAAME